MNKALICATAAARSFRNLPEAVQEQVIEALRTLHCAAKGISSR
jgi:hypothetical protein